MNEKTKYKLVVALLAFACAHFYPNIRDFFTWNDISSWDLNVWKSSNFNTYFTSSSWSSLSSSSIKRDIINSWPDIIVTPKKKLKIAVGLNTNVDLILPAIDLFEVLNKQSSDSNHESNMHNHQILKDLSQFRSTFKYHFVKGSAAERTFLSKADFEEILKVSENLDKKQWFVGGNAALMAQGLSKRVAANSEIYLFGPVGPRLKQMLTLNDSMSSAAAAARIQIAEQSQIDADEVHLILEYGENERFEEARAPRSNRFIVTHDYYNARMEMLDEFFEFVRAYRPDLIILSGLHLLESQTEVFRRHKLAELSKLLQQAQQDLSKSFIHFELASIGDKSLMTEILSSNLLSNIDSLGLNEQELLFLTHSAPAEMAAPHSSYYTEFDGTQPDVDKVLDIIEWVLTRFGRHRRLTRVHFHCLVYHIIAESDDDDANTRRTSTAITKSSLVSGSRVAAQQACGVSDHDLHKLESLVDLRFAPPPPSSSSLGLFNSTHPVVEFKRNHIRFFLTPVLVCRNPVKTVGLGDAISAYGLLYSFE